MSSVDNLISFAQVLTVSGCCIIKSSDWASGTGSVDSEKSIYANALNGIPPFVGWAVDGTFSVNSNERSFASAFSGSPPFVF